MTENIATMDRDVSLVIAIRVDVNKRELSVMLGKRHVPLRDHFVLMVDAKVLLKVSSVPIIHVQKGIIVSGVAVSNDMPIRVRLVPKIRIVYRGMTV
jgi:hypothetical protein